ncbi:hypothetical protein Ancab_006327 [Ancistrocladus abbreviatus]
MSKEGQVVCVTGAAGYIASWIVNLLLRCADRKKTEHLLRLDGIEERLKLFRADLLEEGSFDFVVDGYDGVFHMASPVIFQGIKDSKALSFFLCLCFFLLVFFHFWVATTFALMINVVLKVRTVDDHCVEQALLLCQETNQN